MKKTTRPGMSEYTPTPVSALFPPLLIVCVCVCVDDYYAKGIIITADTGPSSVALQLLPTQSIVPVEEYAKREENTSLYCWKLFFLHTISYLCVAAASIQLFAQGHT